MLGVVFCHSILNIGFEQIYLPYNYNARVMVHFTEKSSSFSAHRSRILSMVTTAFDWIRWWHISWPRRPALEFWKLLKFIGRAIGIYISKGNMNLMKMAQRNTFFVCANVLRPVTFAILVGYLMEFATGKIAPLCSCFLLIYLVCLYKLISQSRLIFGSCRVA